MQILVFVTTDAEKSLRAALSPKYLMRTFQGAPDFDAAVTADPFSAAVFDPTLHSVERFSVFLSLLAERPGAALMFVPLTGMPARRVIECARAGVCELILSDAEIDRPAVERRLAQVADHSASALLLQRLADNINRMPRILQPHVIALFGGGVIPPTVQAFADHVPLGLKTFRRHIAGAGLVRASRLIICARLARTWDLLVSASESVEHVAERAGYPSPQLMRVHYGNAFGKSPRTVARDYDAVRFSRELADYLAT